MVGARRAWFGVHSTILADELTNALPVPIAHAMVHLAQDEAKCDARARTTECANALHANSPRQRASKPIAAATKNVLNWAVRR
jgi:hypothetical protein